MMDALKNLSGEEIKEKLTALKNEHKELNDKVDELASSKILTPEDEVELKRLRKLKLHKKDMIAYLANLLEEK